MANTYRKVYLHIVFAVKIRKALLDKSWRHELFAYMAGSINQRGHFSLAVNGFTDHVHLFFDYNCNELISDLVREIKKSSNAFINDRNLCEQNFEWLNRMLILLWQPLKLFYLIPFPAELLIE